MMQVFQHPNREEWPELCRRPVLPPDDLAPKVRAIMDQVRSQGDKALFELTEKFDGVRPESLVLKIPGAPKLPEEIKKAIHLAQRNITRFHERQREREHRISMQPGVACWRKSIPIEKVGLYIPGGSAPLFSTLLMLTIPAKLAGCRELVICTPPSRQGGVDIHILYIARLLGIDAIYSVGGAQAIAAMAYGTESIPKVDKIFGPGNQYVNCAKLLVQHEGVAIDLPAGPSEVLVIADDSCNPAFVSADLLSQAEHGPDSQVVLVSDSDDVVTRVLRELEIQLERLPRKEVTRMALNNSKAVIVTDLSEAMAFSNLYAPEHLILATQAPDVLADMVINAGSVFLGHYSCESIGDYASGTNHTLPTNGFARSYSGVSLDSFVKKVTFQQVTAQGLQNIGPAVEQMATAEQLDAHRNAVSIRLSAIGNQTGLPMHKRRIDPLIPSTFDPYVIVRRNVTILIPYSSAREDFTGTANIWLDANENPFDNDMNRYPDPRQHELKKAIAEQFGVAEGQIFLGNGSDEAIDLLIRAFCEPGMDRIMIFTPTYGMYLTSAAIHDVDVIRIPLESGTFDMPPLADFVERLEEAKLVFLCSPNNPTGNLLNKEAIRRLAGKFEGLVILDEAYIDFAEDQGMLPELNDIPNLVILRTFSKAWGMAGIRLGMAFAHRSIIDILNKIKPPYNVNILTQEAALSALKNTSVYEQNVRTLISERDQLSKVINGLNNVLKVYPSQANFMLVQFTHPKDVYAGLVSQGIIVRDRSSAVPGCLRITVGTPEENKCLLDVLMK